MKESVFDFGRNWEGFSRHALTAARVEEAKRDFSDLLAGIELSSQSFLDIGFGQGLSLLIAASLGARSVGCDLDPTCADILERNRARFFPALGSGAIPLLAGSILDEGVVGSLRALSSNTQERAFDVVHSWGVVHHTGNMRQAISNAASLVAPRGHLVLAVYARHWSSPVWSVIKRLYNRLPAWGQRVLVAILYPAIYCAKWLVSGGNALKQSRGMDFYYDVVDWVGGYPYEYAGDEEVKELLEPLGFKLDRFVPATVPTGCNQFVFKRIAPGM